MLLVCNGAQKSGSTWLFNILTSLVDCQEPERKYLTGNSKNPCIPPGKLEIFLECVDFANENYISKNHLSKREDRDLLLNYNNVYVFDIERDPRDVVVSSYYDACNRRGYNSPFLNYYWNEGRELVAELSSYHALWRNAGNRCHVACYEALKNEFATELQAIANVLGLSLTPEKIDQLETATNMDSLRKKYADDTLYEGEKFFRKGIIGDWENHFDKTSLEDLESVTESGIAPLDLYHLRFRVRAWMDRRFGN